jgi:DNA-binding NarL/FixJ family response regulator
MKRVRVVLADDHVLFRTGLRALLAELEGVDVIAEAQNGEEAVNQTAEHHPDVVIMDISMKLLNGLEATARIKAESPAVKVIILSMHDAEEYVAQALRVGASAYLLKESTEPEIEHALAAVLRGETYLTPRVSKYIVDGYLRSTEAESSSFTVLTSRQRQLLQMIAEGHSTKETAFRLKLSIKTVESHRARIMERLGIHDVAGLVRYAIRNGLISSDK